jgi:hypothetical protein
MMIFGLQNARMASIIKDTLEKIKGLGVTFISVNTPQSFPILFTCNTLQLVQLVMTSKKIVYLAHYLDFTT